MVISPARTLLSRVAFRTVKAPAIAVPRVAAFQALRIQQQQRRYASSGTKEYTVREALNEALGKLLIARHHAADS